MSENDNLVLISGPSTTGKSASLMKLKNPEGVMYLNTESGKKLPFKSKFKEYTIIDPYQVFEAFTHAESLKEIHTIIIDSVTFLMDSFETMHVLGSSDTMKGWSNYQQFFKKLMQQYVANSTKNVIMTAHTQQLLNENEMVLETKVPVKGALKANGLESYFSNVISTKKIKTKDLAKYQSKLLTVTPQEEALKFKHVFQTQITVDTVHERIRAPLGMWDVSETFIDNDVQLVLDRLHSYYA